MINVRVGSTVKVQGNKSKGVILDIDQNYAKVSIDNKTSTYLLSELEEEDYTLINRLAVNSFDSGFSFILSADAYRLITEYKFNPYVLASSTKINIFAHQIDEVIQILDNPRMMIADEVGLGKTIIAALVAIELKERGLANKILLVVPKSLVIKWKNELSSRFETESQIIDSDYFRKYDNPFKDEAFIYIASIDFLKQNHIMKMMVGSNFDLVVVDEAHRLSYGTERFSLGQFLSNNSNFLLLLTATPHNGIDEEFHQRMRLLDPYFHQLSTTSHLMTRNIKEDVVDLEGREVFPPRETKRIDVKLTEKEIQLHKKVDDYISERLQEASNVQELNAIRFLTIIIRKRASSSIRALKNTFQKRNQKLGTTRNIENTIQQMKRNEEDVDEEDVEENEEQIIGYTLARIPKEKGEISDILHQIGDLQETDSKLQLLLNFITTTKKSEPSAKMVVFTEYRDTSNYLRDVLSTKYNVGSIDGTMNIQERNQALNRFKYIHGSEILVCTDAAGEGIDMQFCNILVNYDLPWNPNKLEQRMGRIHRIGQDRKVFYYNFILSDTIDGYILDKLLKKMESIRNAIGDKIYDVIGRLVTEDEFAGLYEELLRLPKERWEAKVRRIDGIIEEKKRLLDEIDKKLLTGYRLDRSKLENIKKNVQNVSNKNNEVKRFLKTYLDFHKGKLDLLNEEEELYRIFLPKHIELSFRDTRIFEGSFSGETAIRKNYHYLALGNPYIMSLIHDAAKPTVGILKHPNEKGLLIIYKIAVRDGKGRERNGKMSALLVTNDNVKDIKMEDVWEFKPAYASSPNYNNQQILQSKEITDMYADKFANDLVKEALPRLAEISGNTKEAIIRYYSKEIENAQIKLSQCEQRLDESPSFSRLAEREKDKIKQLRNELNKKMDETEKDFDAFPVTEMVGIALVVNYEGSEIKAKLERPGFIPRISDFSKLNQQINSENSQTTNQRLQQDPEEWIEYHRLYREARKEWKVVPYEKMVDRIIEISPRLKVGDFGCGEAKIMERLGESRVFSCDHIAINDKVSACDMKSVPLSDGSLDVVVFSLSLMGKNWVDYIMEARRCLWKSGSLLIAETTKNLTEGRLSDIRNVLRNQGFKIVKEETIDVFTFIEAKKI